MISLFYLYTVACDDLPKCWRHATVPAALVCRRSRSLSPLMSERNVPGSVLCFGSRTEWTYAGKPDGVVAKYSLNHGPETRSLRNGRFGSRWRTSQFYSLFRDTVRKVSSENANPEVYVCPASIRKKLKKNTRR